ncbi:NAD(P)-binding protein [Schizopora paradoxa]|uniref:NAD(P)-binding protein n=1 Tax=Schizopora paradoxa TaxID=27342 RepID=A0A0H2RIZ2_9AGAM|nr:NAD(P)-binding protein [Schizopora paradoxa]
MTDSDSTTASASKPTVFVLGGTGTTGTSVVNGLLDSGKYNVIVGVRPASLSKPAVSKLKERGVEIRAVELTADGAEAIDAALKGVDIVVSTIFLGAIDKQVYLADAAKRVGVRRFVPCDWASCCVRGVRKLFDEKAAIQDHVKTIGLPYTFIDVGIWATGTLPSDQEVPEENPIPGRSHKIIGTGDVKNAITHIPEIGKFAAEIIDDERTLNKYVFCWGDEKTQNEVWEIARRVKPEVSGGEALKAIPIYESGDVLQEALSSVEDGSFMQVAVEYLVSLFIRGDNTVENAKKLEYGGALDARELYPDLKISTVEEVARIMYQK